MAYIIRYKFSGKIYCKPKYKRILNIRTTNQIDGSNNK